MYEKVKNNSEIINISELNKEISLTVEKINKMRTVIDAILNEIGV